MRFLDVSAKLFSDLNACYIWDTLAFVLQKIELRGIISFLSDHLHLVFFLIYLKYFYINLFLPYPGYFPVVLSVVILDLFMLLKKAFASK